MTSTYYCDECETEIEDKDLKLTHIDTYVCPDCYEVYLEEETDNELE